VRWNSTNSYTLLYLYLLHIHTDRRMDKNSDAQLSDPETRIARLFAKCRCGAPAVAAAATNASLSLPPLLLVLLCTAM